MAVLSGNAVEFGLLGDTFVRFIHALDAIQPFVALGWKQLRDFVHAPRSRLASEAGPIVDGLADLESMIAQMALRVAPISDVSCALPLVLRANVDVRSILASICLATIADQRGPTPTRSASHTRSVIAASSCGVARQSLHHNNPSSFDLVDPDPYRLSAMRTVNCRFAVYGEPQVRLVCWIDRLLKCDELLALRACAANRPLGRSAFPFAA